MTKDEKKELFLLILKNWFDDNSNQINFENCIGFYNYFLDCLDFETRFCPEYEPGFHKFLSLTIDLLTHFPDYAEANIAEKSGLKIAILNSKSNIKQESLEPFIGYLTELFIISKGEYIL